MENRSSPNDLPEFSGFHLSLLTVVAYGMAFAFEAGQAGAFGIPLEMVDLQLMPALFGTLMAATTLWIFVQAIDPLLPLIKPRPSDHPAIVILKPSVGFAAIAWLLYWYATGAQPSRAVILIMVLFFVLYPGLDLLLPLLPDAESLAKSDPYQFQWWALGLVGARPVEQKKGADKGIDGRIYFHEGPGNTKQIVLSVKAGKLHAPYVRDLRGVLEREKADIGVLISLEEPTSLMRKEATSAGFYTSPWGKHPRLQIITIEDLLTGKAIDRPPAQASVTFKRAPKSIPNNAKQKSMFEDRSEEGDDSADD